MEFFQHAVLLSAGAVILVQEILKFIPNSFAARWPVLTNVILSIIASVIAVNQDNVVEPVSWTDWTLLIATVSVVAGIVYNQLVGRRNFLQPSQAPTRASRS